MLYARISFAMAKPTKQHNNKHNRKSLKIPEKEMCFKNSVFVFIFNGFTRFGLCQEVQKLQSGCPPNSSQTFKFQNSGNYYEPWHIIFGLTNFNQKGIWSLYFRAAVFQILSFCNGNQRPKRIRSNTQAAYMSGPRPLPDHCLWFGTDQILLLWRKLVVLMVK